MNSFWIKARYGVLLLLVLLITISSHPTIVDMSRAAGMRTGTILSRYIVLAFVVMFAMCINIKSMVKPKLVRVLLIMFGVIAIDYLATFALFGKRTMMSDFRYIGFCIVAIMIGWQIDLDRKRLIVLLLSFSGLSLFAGLMQVITNVGGFEIRLGYFADNKNSLGVMLASSLFAFLFMGLNQQNKTKSFVYYGLVLFTFVITLTIRARAAVVTSVLMLLYVLYERFKGKDFLMYLSLGVIAFIFVLILSPQSWIDYVYDSFFLRFEGVDFTGGRTRRNLAGIQFLSEHLWVGNLNVGADLDQIHNYPLNRAYEFGLIFVIPIMVLYSYLLIKSIVLTIKADNHNIYSIGYYLLLIPFIISMAEPTFPFGPGTATVFNFLLFGVSLRNSYNERALVAPL